MRSTASALLRIGATALLLVCLPHSASAQQLNEHCTVSVLNRNVRVNPDGSWVLPNVPANFGPVRARATCIIDGQTVSGESEPFLVPANGAVNIPRIIFGHTTPIPTSVTITAPTRTLTTLGATVQLTVTASYADGTARNVTVAATGTQYTDTNSAIATITGDGLVQAVKTGTVLIQATHEGRSGMISISLASGGVDSDGDGIPDDYELAHGMNPHNPVDAQEDFDRDGLTNLQEYLLGTDSRNADTDGDGLKDGDEVARGTSPLLRDTDGDGISDGLEVQTGSDPLNPNSFNFAAALTSLAVAPAAFTLSFNTIAGDVFQQLTVTGTLRDGTAIDLTSTVRGTNYASSDLTICSFGGTDGRIFAGNSGPCTITVTLGGLTSSSVGSVRTFSPTPLSFVSIPGFANNVDVNGDIAYVAAGSAGLQVVDVSDRNAPHIVAALNLAGNANDVKLAGGRAYVAAGPAGLHIVDVSNPLAPHLLGSVDTPGDAYDIVVSGNLAFIADGPDGLQIIDATTPASPRLIASLHTPGTAKGVDVFGGLAVVADGASGVEIVDVSNPVSPAIVGHVNTPADARDVAVSGTVAYVADYTGSLQVVNFAIPSAPAIVGTTPPALGGYLMDVAVSGPFVLGADVFFVNGVPIVDVSTPNNPLPRAILDFKDFRDDNGTGIAVDGGYVYLTASRGIVENGTSEATRLYIGQYRALEDLGGVAPTATITAPASGATFVEGEAIPVSVDATDDVAVTSVSFIVNGVIRFSDTAAPYQFTVTAQTGASAVVLGATAVDLAGSVGIAQSVVVNVIPDPRTTVVGQVIRPDGTSVSGALVNCLEVPGASGADGSFSIPAVSTVQPAVTCSASVVAAGGATWAGASAAVSPVRGGTTNVGTIIVVTPLSQWSGENNANDSADGHNGTLQGGVTFAAGKVGQAFTFNGATGYVDLGSWFNLQTFTIDMWVKAGPYQVQAYADIIDNNHTDYRSWVIQFQNATDSSGNQLFLWGVKDGDGGPLWQCCIQFKLTPGVWQHLAITRDSGNMKRLYLDGVLMGQAQGTGPITYDGSQFLRLSQWGGGGRNFSGQIDEIHVFDRALSLAEIQALFAAGK